MRSSKRYVQINWNFICMYSSFVVVNKFTILNAKTNVIEKIMTKINFDDTRCCNASIAAQNISYITKNDTIIY